MYTEFAKKVFELLTLAVACSAPSRHGSREVSISECDAKWRRIKVELLSSGTNYPRDISREFSVFWFYCCFLYEAPFLISRSVLFFTNDKTMNYPCIYMELSFRSGGPLEMYVNMFGSPRSEDDMRSSLMANRVIAWSNILLGISARVWVISTTPREEQPREAWFHLNTLWENPDVGIWTCPVTLSKWWVGEFENQIQTGTMQMGVVYASAFLVFLWLVGI